MSQIYRGSRPAGVKIDVLNSERVREIYKAPRWRAQRGFPHSWNCHSVTNLTTFKLPFCCFQQNRLMERLEWKGEVTEEPADSTEASEVISYGFIPSLINHRLPQPGCAMQPSVVNTLLLESNETAFQPTARQFQSEPRARLASERTRGASLSHISRHQANPNFITNSLPSPAQPWESGAESQSTHLASDPAADYPRVLAQAAPWKPLLAHLETFQYLLGDFQWHIELVKRCFVFSVFKYIVQYWSIDGNQKRRFEGF